MSDGTADPVTKHLEYLNRAVNVIYNEVNQLRSEILARQDSFAANLLYQRARLRDRYGAVRVLTERPVAADSPDHLVPWGTARDNSVNGRFNAKLSAWISPHDLTVLDLGCSGGGAVRSFIEQGCLAVGIEGSDYSLRRQRAEWATIPEFLFTADITAPFTVEAGGQCLFRFSVITAWEVMEHIRSEELDRVLANMARHLTTGGVLIMSVSTRSDVVNGVELHQTVEGKDWWMRKFDGAGFDQHEDIVAFFGNDFVRWEENAPGSFHAILTRAGETPSHAKRLALLLGK